MFQQIQYYFTKGSVRRPPMNATVEKYIPYFNSDCPPVGSSKLRYPEYSITNTAGAASISESFPTKIEGN
ncbi:hypothetical protein GCM10009000_058980 [Halobacterium noricense]|uniref:Uncharacterized protein n=1 Tax=Haladaptatus pallidirubidus TaxID=1008152 RepID=A0AAV3UGV9_9EURY